MINPTYSSFPAIFAMTFPAWLIANIVCGIVNLFLARRLLVVEIVAIFLTIGPIRAYCPLNFPRSEQSYDDNKILTVMTFNTFDFKDDGNIYPDNTNRSASSIIHSGADIVFLQETGALSANQADFVTTSQLDSIQNIYPYSASNNAKKIDIISKYPLTPITLSQPASRYAGYQAAETEINGDKWLIVSVHLESIGLDNGDKEIYEAMTDGTESKEWISGSKTIYHKLSQAFKHRAVQARHLRHQLDSLNYSNVIVAGDFNDIADCYAIRVICGNRMRSAFTECGLGPRITYHNNRIYFNIDHILYQGKLKPLNTWRGNIPSSDHYPVFCNFLLTE